MVEYSLFGDYNMYSNNTRGRASLVKSLVQKLEFTDKNEAISAISINFKHVSDRISLLWGYPELNKYFDDLVIDKRGGRQGFPEQVMSAIFFLQELHSTVVKPPQNDVWENKEK